MWSQMALCLPWPATSRRMLIGSRSGSFRYLAKMRWKVPLAISALIAIVGWAYTRSRKSILSSLYSRMPELEKTTIGCWQRSTSSMELRSKSLRSDPWRGSRLFTGWLDVA